MGARKPLSIAQHPTQIRALLKAASRMAQDQGHFPLEIGDHNSSQDRRHNCGIGGRLRSHAQSHRNRWTASSGLTLSATASADAIWKRLAGPPNFREWRGRRGTPCRHANFSLGVFKLRSQSVDSSSELGTEARLKGLVCGALRVAVPIENQKYKGRQE